MKTFFYPAILIFSFLPSARCGDNELSEVVFVSDQVLEWTRHPCNENGVIASWCDARVNLGVSCSIHPTLQIYKCECENGVRDCPSDCIQGSQLVSKSSHVIQCHGIPKDEPNYILQSHPHNHLLSHHCENNALVANWCNEITLEVEKLDCLLLPALDEYACACYANPAACPQECIGGQLPVLKTKHSIRCKGIPVDQPNYVLKA